MDSVVSLLLGFFLTFLIGVATIPFFQRAQFGQRIRVEGPREHFQKEGTLTMGGIIILLAIGVGVWWSPINIPYGNAWVGLIFGYGLIGGIDDSLKIFRGKNEGLTVQQKFTAQVVVALIFVIPFVINLHIPLLYTIFGAFVIVGSANAVNLTDGLDGLAAGIAGIAYLGFATILGTTLPTVSLPLFFIAGTIFAFLWFNLHPAKWFMGDLGSLAIGAGLGGLALITHTEIALVIVGAVFVAEVVSVIVQVAIFKQTGKRVFRMSPLHHHFELGGLPETQVVRSFWLAGFLCTLVAIALAAKGLI